MRFAIYGAGGLGGYYGARLAEGGNEVGFVARGDHLKAIKKDGLKVLSPLGDIHLKNPLASDNPADIGEVDAVLVAVKTWQVADVARAMRPMVAEHTVVVPFLNGVTAADQIAAELGEQHVLGGLSKVFSLIEAPGVIRHLNPNAYIEIGELNGQASSRVDDLIATLAASGIDAAASANIRTELWKKLLLVASWTGVGTLARSPMGVIREQPETRALIDACIDEGIAVGRAKGLTLDDGLKAQMWSFYDSLPADTTGSMMRDMLEEKPSELDEWVGAIVAFGDETGVPVPVSRVCYHTLLPMERRARGEIKS